MSDERPLFLIMAGPNGAGKSTAATVLLPREVPYLNADEIAKTLPGYPSPAADLTAGQILLRQMAALEQTKTSFAVETTLAGRTWARRAVKARESGYKTELIYLWTPNPDFSIARVAQRVRLGGHSIPEATIRRRYFAGLSNLFRIYLPIFEIWTVYTNTQTSGLLRIARGGLQLPETIFNPPLWNVISRSLPDE